jgi:hypothetical protein
MADCFGRREHLLYSLEHSPIMFASIHGVYDLRVKPESMVVPPNVIIFEVADLGEVTLTTIDPQLWELIQNRRFLTNLISGTVVEPRFLPLLRALHLYMPGDLLYKRKLIYEPENIYDNQWALYRFGPETTRVEFPKSHTSITDSTRELSSPGFKKISDEFLQGIKTNLFKTKRSNGARLRSGMLTDGRNLDYSQIKFISDCQRNYGGDPTIYIISACADIWMGGRGPTMAQTDIESTLSRNQQEVDIRNYECGITTLAFQGNPAGESVALSRSTRVEPPELRLRTGASKGSAKWTEDFAPVLYRTNHPVTGNTSAARAFLRTVRPTGQPILPNLNGESVMLFTEDRQSILYGTKPEWPRKEAQEYAKGKQLLTLARNDKGVLIYIPFKTESEKGMCYRLMNGMMKCFKSGGKRTRRFVKKSKNKRKSRKIKNSL